MTSAVLETPERVKHSLGSLTRDYLQLSKSRIVLMVLITTAAGFLFATDHVDGTLMLHALLGTALVAAGTNALNQYVERDHDARGRVTADGVVNQLFGSIAHRGRTIRAAETGYVGEG